MKFLLEIDHYVDDRLLEKGAYVGDAEGCVHDWRYRENQVNGAKAGERRPLSSAMTPMDDEAKKLMKQQLGRDKAIIDPTAAIPIQGTTQSPGLSMAKAPPLAKGN